MFAMPEHGFVFLSTTKTGSTAVENAFAGRASLMFRQPPPLKHMSVRKFQRLVAPILTEHGYPPDSYELVCVVREPVDWVASWWRYRSRPDAAGTLQYTGDLTFDEFADRVIARKIRVGNLKRFVLDDDGRQAVSRLFRYDRLDHAVEWMAERAGMPIPTLRVANASPERDLAIDPQTRARLEGHFAVHRALYEQAV